jgi:hypothetical protein
MQSKCYVSHNMMTTVAYLFTAYHDTYASDKINTKNFVPSMLATEDQNRRQYLMIRVPTRMVLTLANYEAKFMQARDQEVAVHVLVLTTLPLARKVGQTCVARDTIRLCGSGATSAQRPTLKSLDYSHFHHAPNFSA